MNTITQSSNFHALFAAILFLSAGWVTAYTQEWEKVIYDPRAADFISACVVDDTTYALFGSQGNVTIVNSKSLSARSIRGERLMNDVLSGAALTNDTLLIFESSGEAFASVGLTETFFKYQLPNYGAVRACLYTSNSDLVLCAASGLVLRDAAFTTRIWPEITGSSLYESDSNDLFVGTLDGELLRYKRETQSWDTVFDADNEILRIAGCIEKLWFVTNTSLYSSPHSSGYVEWRTTDLGIAGQQDYGQRDLVCIDDTLILSSFLQGSYVYQEVSADGQTWIGNDVSIKGVVNHRMIVGTNNVLFYGVRGFFRIARSGSIYNDDYYRYYGLGVGREAAQRFFFRSMVQLSEAHWLAATTSPSAVIQSLDSGRTWTTVMGGKFESTEYLQLEKDSTGVYLLADSVRSIPDGQSWKTVYQWVLLRSEDGFSWSSISADSIDSRAKGMVVGPRGYIYLYGGKTAYRIKKDLSSVDILAVQKPGLIVSMSSNRSGTLALAGIEIGISNDEGDTWQYYPLPSSSVFPSLIQLYDDGRIVLIVNPRNSGLSRVVSYASVAPYQDWEETTIIPERRQLLSPRDIAWLPGFATVVTTQSGYVALSFDRGASWTLEWPLGTSGIDMNAVHIREPQIVRVGGDGSTLLEKHFAISNVSEQNPAVDNAQCNVKWQPGYIVSQLPIESTQPARVYDIAGRIIEDGVVEPSSGGFAMKINRKLTPGIYYLITLGPHGSRACKFSVPPP